MLLTPGQTVDAFVVVELIDDGGAGQVYRVRRPRSRQERALKVLTVLSPKHRLKLLDGVLLVAELRHRCLIHIEDVVELPDALGLVTEFVDGPSLQEIIVSDEPLGEEEASAIFEQLGAVVRAAHAAGVANLGLGPRKVLLAEAPEGVGVRVVGIDLAGVTAVDPAGIQVDLAALGALGAALGVPSGAAATTNPPASLPVPAPAPAAEPTAPEAVHPRAPPTRPPAPAAQLASPRRLLAVTFAIFCGVALWQAAERADEVQRAEAHIVVLANALDGPFRSVGEPLAEAIARAGGALAAPADAFTSAATARARVERARELVRALRAEVGRQRLSGRTAGGELALAAGQVERIDEQVSEAETALAAAETLSGEWTDQLANALNWLDSGHIVGDAPIVSAEKLDSFR